MTSGEPDTIPVVVSGPEELFGVGAIGYDGSTVSASMPTGPWLADATGRIGPGALGVLADNVLGYALIATRPAGHWSVSTEITVDLLEPLPGEGRLHAEARVVRRDRLGGFATGSVIDDAGRLLALTSQRGRFVPAPGGGLRTPAYERPPGSDVVAWLARTYADGETHAVDPVLANPMGNVHGGISLCLADLAAAADAPPGLVVASVRITYVRPIPIGAGLALHTQVRHGGRSLGVLDVTGLVGGRAATVTQVVLQSRPEG